MSSRIATPTIKSVGSRFISFAEKLDDGAILRATFIVMLVGTISVLVLDYFELTTSDINQPVYVPTETPVLPAIERPEVDPDNPGFAPQTRITTDMATLRQPVRISLLSDGILQIEGAITPGAADALAEELSLRGDYVEQIKINSPGGIVDEAMAMGRLIRAAELPTMIAAGDFCGSSCPLVFAGGVERIAEAGAAIGVHQIYAANGGTVSAAQSLSDAQAITGKITRYLVEMNIDPALWIHALETPPDMLYYFTSQELEKFALATEPASTQ